MFQGEPFDSAYLWSVNDMLSDAALRLALRAFLRGNPGPDAVRAAEVLTGYARCYRNLPVGPKTNPNFPGVVTFTALDESVWLIRVAWAYSLLRGMLTPEDQALIGREILLPAAEHILRIRWPEVHNVTNWNNAALVALGLALGEDRFVTAGVEAPLGLAAELSEGVLADGLWWERSLSYHYYSLAALVWTVRSLEAGGRPFAGDATLRRMFSAPILLAFPDLTLPAVDDCWYFIGLTGEVGHGIPDAAGFYETAYARYGDPEFAWVLERNYATRPRAGIEALLDGAERIAGGRAPQARSCVLPESGLAVLRSGTDSLAANCLVLKAGPDGGVHGHPDQLAIQLSGAGARLVPDLGTPGYGIALNDTWYRQTASHSTVLIDGRSQPPATGRIGQVESRGDFELVHGSVSWGDGPYAGAELRRMVIGCKPISSIASTSGCLMREPSTGCSRAVAGSTRIRPEQSPPRSRGTAAMPTCPRSGRQTRVILSNCAGRLMGRVWLYSCRRRQESGFISRSDRQSGGRYALARDPAPAGTAHSLSGRSGAPPPGSCRSSEKCALGERSRSQPRDRNGSRG